MPFMGVFRETRDRKPWIFPFKMGLSGDNFPFQSIDMGDGHQSLFGVLDGFAWFCYTIFYLNPVHDSGMTRGPHLRCLDHGTYGFGSNIWTRQNDFTATAL